MVRNYKRNTDKGRTPEDVLNRAVKMVLNDKCSRKSVSDDFNIPCERSAFLGAYLPPII